MNQVVMMNNFISAIRSLFSSAVTKICLRGKGYGREFAPLLPRPNPLCYYLHILYPALNDYGNTILYRSLFWNCSFHKESPLIPVF